MSSLLCLVGVLALLSSSAAAPKRSKREAYSLPSGIDLLLSDIRSTFTCPGDGYYADVDNNCQIFHVCHGLEDGSNAPQQWSFACGNQTVFNQLTFTCSFPEEAVSCDRASEFFYLNKNVQQADPEVPFLSDQDIQNAAPHIPGFRTYGARIPAETRPARG